MYKTYSGVKLKFQEVQAFPAPSLEFYKGGWDGLALFQAISALLIKANKAAGTFRRGKNINFNVIIVSNKAPSWNFCFFAKQKKKMVLHD